MSIAALTGQCRATGGSEPRPYVRFHTTPHRSGRILFAVELRRHPSFAPEGANVDFVAAGPGTWATLRLRTYERGVEDETLACGTGAVAAALCVHVLRGAPPPVKVLVRSGKKMTVNFQPDSGGFKDVWLEGPAQITFHGEIVL